ncbi:hypothetical protein RDI58_004613 [Solanum bulbocastanum]|uniref:Ulp1 protease family, C-terminal catalytic domain containing protein n=1 Tax=Solanum bulbocastanum TaxID=147425 RepID=A0AAN8U6U9_SOLBU
MDDHTPATRLTRGMHLHGRKFDEKPSFSLGLTQEFEEVDLKQLESKTNMKKFRRDFDLVESDRYMDYPWGKKAFDLLIQHLHTKVKHDGKYYRILNWKTKKDFPRLYYFAKGMF